VKSEQPTNLQLCRANAAENIHVLIDPRSHVAGYKKA
jgi:hypothetical protein